MNAASAEIVGVMPQGFRVVDTQADLITPLRSRARAWSRRRSSARGIARLKPGVTIEQANADLARLLPIWLERFPFPNGG